MVNLKDYVRTIPDYPVAGVQYRDISTLLSDRDAFAMAINALAASHEKSAVDAVAGIEARGFIVGGAVAHHLGVGFIPLRKSGKLPWRTISEEYELEYGRDTIEMHMDGACEGQEILLIDDLVATGGTALAAIRLIEKTGARVVGASFIIELHDLGGGDRIRSLGKPVHTLIGYAGD